MNISTADVLKRVCRALADTTEHLLLVHVVILEHRTVVRALAIPLIAAAKYVLIIAADAAALIVQHLHHHHVQTVLV
jgi:hypothetical protein